MWKGGIIFCNYEEGKRVDLKYRKRYKRGREKLEF